MSSTVYSKVDRYPRVIIMAAVLCGLALLTALSGEAPGARATTLSSTMSTGALTVTETADGPAALGTPEIITFAVTNTSQSQQSNLQIEGVADNTLLIIKVLSTQLIASCPPNDGNWLFICLLSPLQPGDTAIVRASVTPPTTDPLSISGIFSGVGVVHLSIPVNLPTDIQVTGSASTGSPARGAIFSYTFQVKDNGPYGAPGVTFSDSLPAALTFVAASTTQGSCTQSGGTVSCSVGDVAVGKQANVVITVQAPTAPATITDSASIAVADTVTDTKAANNTVSVAVQVK